MRATAVQKEGDRGNKNGARDLNCIFRDRAEKRLRKSMSCGNDCGLRRGLIQNGGLLAGKKQLEFKMKK